MCCTGHGKDKIDDENDAIIFIAQIHMNKAWSNTVQKFKMWLLCQMM